MRLYEMFCESMSDIDIELQDYKAMTPIEFQKAYGISKQQWYQKYQGVVGKMDQHHTHKAHTYKFFIPGEDTYLNRYETKHFVSDLEAEQERRRLQKTNPGTTYKKVN